MPQQVQTRKTPSEQVQGEGSFVVFRVFTYGESKALRQESLTHKGDDEWAIESTERLLREHIVEWNWGDVNGVPLALPKDDASVIGTLTADEIKFLSEGITGTLDPKG